MSTGAHLLLKTSEIDVMPVVNLSFVTDDSKEIVLVQHIRARIPLVR